MNSPINRRRLIQLNILGYYQIIGGITGVCNVIYEVLHINAVTGAAVLLYFIALGLYLFSVICGWLLIKRQLHMGFRLTLTNQSLQIMSFMFAGYAFRYISGLGLEASINSTSAESGVGIGMGFNLSLLSGWRLFWNSDDYSFNLSVNLLAIFLLYFIVKLRDAVNFKSEEYSMQ